jgi:hypothetical protein
MNKNIAQKIEQLTSGIVNTMFEGFQNPSYQGSNFTWEKFPEMMKDLAEGYTPATFYTLKGEKLAEVEKEAGERAFILAQEKVKEFLNKQP